MIRAKHTIMVPGRTVAPGELVTIAVPGSEQRLVNEGHAEFVEPFPQDGTPYLGGGKEPGSPPAAPKEPAAPPKPVPSGDPEDTGDPEDPETPPDDPPGDAGGQSAPPKALKKIGQRKTGK